MNVEIFYIQPDKKSGMLSYRRRFPKDLSPFIPRQSGSGIGRTELKVSLRARKMNEPGATERHGEAQRQYDEIVIAARKARKAHRKREAKQFDELDATTTASLAERFYARELADDAARRIDPDAKARQRQIGGAMASAGYQFPGTTPEAEWTLSLRALHQDLRSAARSMRANGDIEGLMSLWGPTATALASEAGYEVEPGGSSLASLSEALHNAAIEASEAALRRLDGDLVPTPPEPSVPQKSRGAPARSDGLSLLTLFEQYAAVPGRSPKTMAQWRPYIQHLATFVGDDDVRRVTHDHLVSWRNHLRDRQSYRGKPLSAKTINGSYMGAVSAIFAWAKGDGIIALNPMREITKVKLPVKETTRGKAFTMSEAITILQASLVASNSKEVEELRNAKRWCPWLMAYSGARVNEITQLRKEDIFEQDGVMLMRLTPKAGTIKSRSFRLVPLHSHLIEQGFLKFVERREDGPLFYNPAKRRSDAAINRQSNRLGSKLAEWVGGLGIVGVKPNHAWRNMFISMAVRHQLDPRASKAITGHAASTVHETYITDYVDVLARELEKMPRFEVC